MKTNIRSIVRIGIIAGMYIVLTIINPFSYDSIQFRISEILMLLCFFRKDYSIALIIGCFISNIFSPIALDMLFGTLATAIAALCIMYSKNIYLSIIYPIIFNGLIVAFELYITIQEPFLFSLLTVSLGEAVVMIIGLIIFVPLRKNSQFMNIIQANQNLLE